MKASKSVRRTWKNFKAGAVIRQAERIGRTNEDESFKEMETWKSLGLRMYENPNHSRSFGEAVAGMPSTSATFGALTPHVELGNLSRPGQQASW